MQLLLYSGLGLFLVGLVLSHVVLALSRTPKKKGAPLPVRLRVLMWTGLGLSVLGAALTALALLL